MTLAPELVPLFMDTVTFEKWLGRDKYNKPSYVAPTTLLAHVEETAKLIRDSTGADRMSMSQVWVEYPLTGRVDFNDRITLSDGRQPVIMSVENWEDENAVPYYVRIYT